MTWMTLITTIIKFIPELLEIVRSLADGIQAGMTQKKLKKDLQGISTALKEKNRAKAASDLNDIFHN